MTEAEIPVIFIDDTNPDATGWNDLQAGLGQGFATMFIETPDRRGEQPRHDELRSSKVAPVADMSKVREGVSDLLGAWRMPFETILNRRWSLCENPYAKAWLLPGAILLHEDPLGWVIDAQAEDLATGGPLDLPSWAILMPKAKSNHEAMSHMSGTVTLPHKTILDGALDRAARSENHHALCPMTWVPQTITPGVLDIIGLDR